MGIIEERVRNAFKEYEKDGNLYKFATEMAHIGDYSVRSMTHWYHLIGAVDKIKAEKIEETVKLLPEKAEKEIFDLEF
ncbi:MAG: hypothetical protein ACFFG0_00550 [Candidatus Thorarchaeota archaeon]